MKRTAVITAITVASILLVSCQSERDRKTEICAEWAVTKSSIKVEEVVIAETWEKLGIKAEMPAEEDKFDIRHPVLAAIDEIEDYCEFYKG